ncbi:MAG: HAD family phosphatase [Oscillospiraceae bacterium]|nr:HAD family phosphatase [Oscillospiraceae bacterium]
MYIFDLDGTLIDSTDVWHQIDLDFLKKYNTPWSPAYDLGVMYSTFPVSAVFTKEYCHLPQSPEEIMAEWLEMAHHAYAHTIPLKPFVREFLEQCRRDGISMAIYTSCEPELAEAVLQNNGIRDYFSQIVYARDLGCEKQDPAAYPAVLNRLDVKKEEITFFDDSPVNTMGAIQAGWNTIGVYDRAVSGSWADFCKFCPRCVKNLGELVRTPY